MPRLIKWWIRFEIVLLVALPHCDDLLFSQELGAQSIEKDFDALIRAAQKYVVSIVAQSDTHLPTFDEGDSTAALENSLMIVDKKVSSGFIVDSQGIIVTRQSVLEGMKSVSVIMQNGEGFNAEVVGADNQFNIALLKVKALTLENPLFAQDAATRIGDWVLVVSNSLGFNPSISLGTVTSALDQGIIKINAAIGPGSIGAPVFNLRGQVIGILAARMVSDYSGQFPPSLRENEAIVIPMGPLLPRINQMIKTATTENGWVGMSVTTYPENDKLPVFKVTQIYKDSPAETTGVLLGDEILTFDNKPIPDLNYLVRTISKLSVNQILDFEFRRGTTTFHKKIQVGKRPTLYTLQIRPPADSLQPEISSGMQKAGPTIDQMLLQRRINQLEGEIHTLQKLMQRQPAP